MLFWLLFSSKSIQNILILSAIVAPWPPSPYIFSKFNLLNTDTLSIRKLSINTETFYGPLSVRIDCILDNGKEKSQTAYQDTCRQSFLMYPQ